jgi:hypothetical protein
LANGWSRKLSAKYSANISFRELRSRRHDVLEANGFGTPRSAGIAPMKTLSVYS